MLPGQKSFTRVVEALENNGYSDKAFLSCTFVKMTDSGKEQHQIEFEGEDGDETGFVYVWEENGKLVADY